MLAGLIENPFNEPDGISGGQTQPAVAAMLTVLFERQLRTLPQRGVALRLYGSQPDDPGRAGASM